MVKKSADAFRTISEVAEWLDTPAHVLRFWESKFSQIKPVKRAGGRRYYRPSDMQLLSGIKKLLHEDGMTIKGTQKLLREKGLRYVAAMSAPLDDDLEQFVSHPAPGEPPIISSESAAEQTAPTGADASDSFAVTTQEQDLASDASVQPTAQAAPEEAASAPDGVAPAPIAESAAQTPLDEPVESEVAPAAVEEAVTPIDPAEPAFGSEPAHAPEPVDAVDTPPIDETPLDEVAAFAEEIGPADEEVEPSEADFGAESDAPELPLDATPEPEPVAEPQEKAAPETRLPRFLSPRNAELGTEEVPPAAAMPSIPAIDVPADPALEELETSPGLLSHLSLSPDLSGSRSELTPLMARLAAMRDQMAQSARS